MARAARTTTFIPQATPIIQPIESMKVEPGTLTVTLSSTGALTPADNQVLSFWRVRARDRRVNVAVGDQVHAGDILAQLDTTNIDAQIRNAQLSLTQAQNSLNALTAPPREIDLKIARGERHGGAGLAERRVANRFERNGHSDRAAYRKKSRRIRSGRRS